MTNLLFQIDGYAWLCDFIAVCIFLVLSWKEKTINSSLIALAVSIIVGKVMLEYSPKLLAAKTPENLALVTFVWYVGFVFFDAVAIFAIYKSHAVRKIRYSLIAKMVLLSFFVKAQLHLLRYTERLIWDTDFLMPLYKSGIVSINVTTAITAIIFAVIAYIQYYRSGATKWKI
jgi:hypothetical protein